MNRAAIVLDDLMQPRSSVASAALEVLQAYSPPALANHCLRSYAFAAALGLQRDIEFDTELLYVSAVLHDIGLTPQFDSHTVPFEEAGGHVARVFGAGAGWPLDRRIRASEIIVRHMLDEMDPATDPEGHLLLAGTHVDVVGENRQWWPRDFRAEVVARFPRLSFVSEFSSCLVDQARRKSSSLAGEAVRRGLHELITDDIVSDRAADDSPITAG